MKGLEPVKFNPITATPDAIAEFVKTIKEEDLRFCLMHSFLQMKKINAKWERVMQLHMDNSDAIIRAIESGKIIVVDP